MIQCLNCLEFVEKLKSNSHIIPRWAMLKTKERGGNLSILYGKASNNTKDLMTESWCESCEKGFGNLDNVGSLVFKNLDKKYKCEYNEINFQPFKYTFTTPGNLYYFSKFIYSTAVRLYLCSLNTGYSLREKEVFKDMFDKYQDDKKMRIDINDVSKFFSTTVKLPAVVKGKIQLMINGYLIVIHPDIYTDATDWLSGEKEMLILKVTDPRVPYVKSFFEAMRSRKMPEPPKWLNSRN